MTCGSVAQPIAQLINRAYGLAGKPNGSIASGPDMDLGVTLLNLILAEWSVSNLSISYLNEITFNAFDNKKSYSIGSGMDINENPFNTITKVWYVYGGTNNPVQYQTKGSFNYYTYNNQTALPAIYTYNNQEGVTNIEFLPRPIAGLEIHIFGKQMLTDVTLFNSASQIPKHGILAMEYQLANELINRGKGVPQPNFGKTLAYHLSVLKKSSKQDRQMEIKPALQDVNAGRGYGWYRGGYNGR